MKDREHTLEKSKQLLMKENKELREKAESLKSHSSKFNSCVFRLPIDIEKEQANDFMVSLFNELFRDKNVAF